MTWSREEIERLNGVVDNLVAALKDADRERECASCYLVKPVNVLCLDCAALAAAKETGE